MSCVLVYIFLWCHTRICRTHIQTQDNQETCITVNHHQTPHITVNHQQTLDIQINMPE
jgi:hypothetical protein